MTQRAADDYETIQRRLVELTQPIQPRCAVPSRPAYVSDCLRSATQCPETCPLRHDWIGP